MSVLRKGGVSSRGSAAKVVHAAASPYGSRRLVVETDGDVTVAYLKDARDSVVGATWVANHRKAPPELDQSRLDAGRPPLLPASHLRDPSGRKALDAESLEVVWFEEGDGVAVLEAGDPLFVIPGWSDMGRGIPGYARDAVRHTAALGSVAATTVRAPAAEAAMEGRRPDRDMAEAAAAALSDEIVPIDDVRSTADYRRAVAGRVLRRLIRDAGGW